MNCLQQNRTNNLARYIIHHCQQLDLTLTAETLKQETQLIKPRNVSQDIQHILNTIQATEQQRKQQLKKYFKQYLTFLLMEGLEEQAVELYTMHIPIYFHNIDQFSLMFAGESMHKDMECQKLFQNYLKNEDSLPQTRVDFKKYANQIWFIKTFGDKVVLIDQKSVGRIMKFDKLLVERKDLHVGRIFCLTVKNQEMFATGGQDSICRVWNSKFQKIYETMSHQSRINAIVFSNTDLISFDNSGKVFIHKNIPNKHFASVIQLKPITDARYLNSLKLIVAVSNEGKQCDLRYLDLQNSVTKKVVRIKSKIYNIQLSNCQKLIFMNTTSMQILVYSTRSHIFKYKFTGYLQKNFLMRMCTGGNNSRYLAMTSQDGYICIYDTQQQQQMYKIKVSSSPINCATWVGSEIYMGCDNGNVQIWSSNVNEYEQRKQTYNKCLSKQGDKTRRRKSIKISQNSRQRIKSQQTHQ